MYRSNIKFSFPLKNVPMIVPEPFLGWSTKQKERHEQKEACAKEHNSNFTNFTMLDGVPSEQDRRKAALMFFIKNKTNVLLVEHLLAFNGNSDVSSTSMDSIEFQPHYKEINLVDDSKETSSWRYAEDISNILLMAVKKMTHEFQNYIKVRLGYTDKTHLMWVVYGDPILLRYLTVRGDKQDLIIEYSHDNRLKDKLLMFPLVINFTGDNKTFCEVEVENVTYWKSKENSLEKSTTGETFIKITTVLPLLARFNMVLKEPNPNKVSVKIE